ncbi:enoyl-CoA hydratase [Stappia sp. MMSF_3263]|uniref:enoyl-CoA hydratase n=1 Tax=Stappia sp. MMSF_3263 TaxID=3046693 RepID=UPI00273FC9D5|nr:enoyl-CoA hydratase [Stappia sp. MMSF_3263]
MTTPAADTDANTASTRTQDAAVAGRVRIGTEGQIGWIVIDNERRRNALTLAMWAAIPEAVARLCADPEPRVIVLRGAGDDTFVAGADISEFATVRRDAASARAYEAANAAAFDALREASLPTIAMVRGFCLGGGFGLAAACDLRIADATARFGIPAARLGVGYPPSAIADVVRLVGPSRAKLLFFTARQFGASEAQGLGIVDTLATDTPLEQATRDLAQAIAQGAPLTLKAAKAGIDALTAHLSDEELATCQALADACFDSADFAEGRAAFMEKRTPRFTGSPGQDLGQKPGRTFRG